MKYLRKRFKLVLVLMVTALTLTSCNRDDDKIQANETPKEFANRICSIDEGMKLENVPNGPITVDAYKNVDGNFIPLNSRVINTNDYVYAKIYLKGTGPLCDFVTCGILYTTDGSTPTIDNPNTKKIILKPTGFIDDRFEVDYSFAYNSSLFPTFVRQASISSSSFDVRQTDLNYGLDVTYYPNIEAYYLSVNQYTQNQLNTLNRSDYFTNTDDDDYQLYYFFMTKQEFPGSEVLDASNVNYRGFIQSLKDDNVFYTPVNAGIQPAPSEVSLNITNTSNVLSKNINATLTSKKAVNGYIYTSSSTAFTEFTQGNISNWTKVFVPDTELTVNPNNTEEHSFTATIDAEANKDYYVIAFTSDDNTLTAATTKTSLVQGFNTSAGKPTVDVSTTNTENSITINGIITNNGNTPVTAYGLKLYSDASYTTVIGESNQTGAPTSTFTFNKDALTPNTTYYAEAYATNSVGTSNARQEVTLTTVAVVAPTVTIDQPTSNDSGIVTLVGHVTDNGNGTITNYTFEITDEFGAPIVVNQANVTGNAASFTYTFDSLGSDTVNVKAKATNSAGTGESVEIMYSVF